MADVSAAVDNLKDDVTDAGRRVAAVLPLWVIIIIVVVGTGLLALLVGLCCLCVCRRRRGRKAAGGTGAAVSGYSDIVHHPATALPSDGGSRSSEEGGPGGRHKLRKRPPSSSSSSSFGNDGDGGVAVVVDDRGVEVEEVEEGHGRGEPEFRNMASVPARKASLLAIPPLLTGALRASIVTIGGARRSAGGRGGGSGGLNINTDEAARQAGNWHGRRTSEAWIDDDALHGPEVSPSKRSSRKSRMKSWGASIRESWPLKTPSPTLPLLPNFGGQASGAAEHESVALFQYKNYDSSDGYRNVPNLPARLSTAANERNGHPSPPRQLPKPPTQALLAANATTAGLRPANNFYGVGSAASNSPRNRGLSYYKYEDSEQSVRSSGSPHSKTQRGVGVGTGVVGPRGRQPSANSTMSQILKDTEKRLQDGTATGVATRNRSGSSPSKRTPALGLGPDAVTVALVRSRSRTPSPTKAPRMPHGAALSHVRQGSQASFASEPDSLLDEAPPSLPYHGLTSPSRSKPSQQLSPHRRRPSLVPSFASSASSLSTIQSETEDPLTPNTTAPNSSIPFGLNQTAGLGDPFMPSKNSTPASKKAQSSARHGAQDPGNQPSTSKRDKNLHARSGSPLSPVTGNMRSADTTPIRGGARNATAQGADKVLNRDPQRDDQSSNIQKRKPSDDAIPNLSLTIPGDRGKTNPLVKRLSDLAPPFRSRDQTPEVAHPSPALSNARLSSVYDFYADMSEPPNVSNPYNDNNKRRRAGGEVRMVSSSAASVSSSLYSDTSAAERERERQNAALSRISMLLNRDVTAPSRPKPTVRVVSRDYYPHGAAAVVGSNDSGNKDARVSATVAELRRMNSQVSTYSTAAASMYSNRSSTATLAAARPESVVPPRRGAAARNYLALGSPVKSSPDREVRGRDEVGSPTPTRNRRLERADEMGGSGSGSGSGSEDGVSLYDQDGFYITPARRAGLRS